MSRGISFDFDKFPVLLELAKDPSYVKMVIGPAGSAKTSGLFALTLYLALQQFPGNDGVRRTRVAVIRQSYQQLSKNTVNTIRTILGGLVSVSDGKPPTAHAKFPLADGTSVELDFVFYALESPGAANDALGAEFTIAVFDEVSSMADEDLVTTFISRLGRYPSPAYGQRNDAIVCALGATNGPLKAHWLYQWSQGLRNDLFAMISKRIGRNYFKLFRQPPALILNPDGTYDPNPAAENIDHLPGGHSYYYSMLTRPKKDIQAYVLGEFADLSAGKVVYTAFRTDFHVIPQAKFLAQWGKTGVIGLTFDFGRTPVCLCWKDLPGGGIVVFDEFTAADVSIDTMWQNVVRPALLERYPRCVAGRSGFTTGDPSGFDISQVVELSPYQVLQQHGLDIEFPGGERKDKLEPRIEAVRQRLTRLDGVEGNPMLQVTDNCVQLIEALSSTYIYKEIRGSKGAVSDVPCKDHFASDLANALEYLCLYRRAEMEPPAVGVRKSAGPPLLGG